MTFTCLCVILPCKNNYRRHLDIKGIWSWEKSSDETVFQMSWKQVINHSWFVTVCSQTSHGSSLNKQTDGKSPHSALTGEKKEEQNMCKFIIKNSCKLSRTLFACLSQLSQCFKEPVHPKMSSVIIYAPSCHSKPVITFFICGTLEEIFNRMSKQFFPLQWKWTVSVVVKL